VLDVVDPLLFVRAVHARFDVIPRGIAHPAWLRLPGLRDFARRYGVIAAREPDAAGRALRESGLLLLFPGAVREAALRDYRREPYRLKWKDRTGFLRLALEHDAEILFVAAVGTEDLYYQSRLRVPDPLVRYLANGDAARYRGMRLMVGVLGPHVVPAVLPFPAQITHVVSDPLDLGDRARALSDEATFGALHERVWDRCQTLLDDAVRARPADDSLADLGVRAGHAVLRRLGL